MNYHETYRDMLKQELRERKALNPGYSMRAFARDLDIEAPRLSMILAAKKGLSVDKATKLLRCLSWSDLEKSSFINMVSAVHGRSKKERETAETNLKELIRNENKIDNQTFEIISDPLHYTIIELIKTKNFKHSPSWMAKRLDIDEDTLIDALDRLLDLKIIKKIRNKYRVEDFVLTTPEHIPSNALKLHHSRLIRKALNSIREQDITERTLSSLIVAVPEELIPEVFEKVSSFRKEINHFIMSNTNKENSQVYCLGTQFFKLTKDINDEN